MVYLAVWILRMYFHMSILSLGFVLLCACLEAWQQQYLVQHDVVVAVAMHTANQPAKAGLRINLQYDTLFALFLLASEFLLAGVSGTDCILHGVCSLLLGSEQAPRAKHAQCFTIQIVGKDTLSAPFHELHG